MKKLFEMNFNDITGIIAQNSPQAPLFQKRGEGVRFIERRGE